MSTVRLTVGEGVSQTWHDVEVPNGQEFIDRLVRGETHPDTWLWTNERQAIQLRHVSRAFVWKP